MTVTIELSESEIAQIKSITNLDDDAKAVSAAAREFLRLKRLRELKDVSGKVDFELNWEQLEALEISETPFPE